MIVSPTIVCLSVALFVAASGRLQAQATRPADIQKSCRNFVDGFYLWYVPKTLTSHDGPAFTLALKEKESVFSPELFRMLQQDSDAQAKASEIVGLDFDPFLNSQDPEESYVVGTINVRGDRYFVDIHGKSSGRTSAKPAVVAELILRDARWLFVNFHYGVTKYQEDENLLSVLKTLRANRQKSGHALLHQSGVVRNAPFAAIAD